jgi:3-phenylpropionate/trans-cinnamate dioxygenase ferredoxin reductase subunit
MSEREFTYVIVGGGLAGASAVEGIRERDADGSVLLVGEERHLPYNRPPLSKQLWFGKSRVGDVFVHDHGFYDSHGVEVASDTRAVGLDAGDKRLFVAGGDSYRFEKLLLATGVAPRRLEIPGNDLDGVCYYHTLDDYLRIQPQVGEAKSALVIGGGFIGSELAAALNINLDVSLVFPGEYLCSRVFPRELGLAIQRKYQERGIQVVDSEMPVSIERSNGGFVTRTTSGRQIPSDLVVVGIGTVPNLDLAREAGLETGDGIVVNEYLQTSHADIYAAGDIAQFPHAALGQRMRIEHWDNALNQGKWAGRNMTGAGEPFDYQPFFFSDLFEFGYEATGDVSTRLETFADWKKENETGVVYYLADGRVRGVMTCNLWDRMDQARDVIRAGEQVTADSLRGLIR